MRAVHATVCVLIQNDRSLEWLGHKPVYRWVLDALRDVRGIDRLVQVVHPEFSGRIPGENFEATFTLPAKELFRDYSAACRWLAADARLRGDAREILIALRPTCPFLTAARIETMISLARDRKARSAFTARRAQMSDVVQGKPFNKLVAIEAGGCRMFHADSDSRWPWLEDFHPVPINLIESVDVVEAEGLVLAGALVEAGVV